MSRSHELVIRSALLVQARSSAATRPGCPVLTIASITIRRQRLAALFPVRLLSEFYKMDLATPLSCFSQRSFVTSHLTCPCRTNRSWPCPAWPARSLALENKGRLGGLLSPNVVKEHRSTTSCAAQGTFLNRGRLDPSRWTESRIFERLTSRADHFARHESTIVALHVAYKSHGYKTSHRRASSASREAIFRSHEELGRALEPSVAR
jgi:hypothetical protein